MHSTGACDTFVYDMSGWDLRGCNLIRVTAWCLPLFSKIYSVEAVLQWSSAKQVDLDSRMS